MNGNETITIKGRGISFPNFYNNPTIDVEDLIVGKEISWAMEVGFAVGKRIEGKEELKISITVNLLRASDKEEISTLEIECKHDVFAPIDLPQLHKFNLLTMYMNAAVGQLQGGWVAKHSNETLKLKIPPININDVSFVEDLKKKISEKWETVEIVP